MRKVDDISGSVLFRETVGLPKWIVRLPVMAMAFMSIFAIIDLFVNENGRIDLLIAMSIILPPLTFSYLQTRRMKLEKIITSNGLYFKWSSYHKKYRFIGKEEVQKIRVRKSPRLTYGPSWTLTYGSYHGVNNKEGLQLYLVGSKRVFLEQKTLRCFKK